MSCERDDEVHQTRKNNLQGDQLSNDDDTRIDRDKFSQSAIILHPKLHDVLFSTLLNGYAGYAQALADSTHVEIERTLLLCQQFHRIVAGKSSAHRGKCSGEKIEQIFITYEWHWRMRNGAKQEEIEFIFGIISRKASFYRTKTKRAYLPTCFCVDGSNLLMLLNNLNFDVWEHVFYRNGSGTRTLLSLKPKPQ